MLNHGMMRVRFSVVIGALAAFSIALGSATSGLAQQSGFVTAPGKAWRLGVITDASMIQLVVDNVQKTGGSSSTFTGKVSIRSDSSWLVSNAVISGTGTSFGPNMSFEGTAQAGGGTVTLRGFYSAGEDPYSQDDDHVFAYHIDDIGPESDPCDPDDEVLNLNIEVPIP